MSIERDFQKLIDGAKETSENLISNNDIRKRCKEDNIYKLLTKWAKGNNCIPKTLGFRRKLAKDISSYILGEKQ